MQHVWLLFKVLEVIVGSICLTIHITSLDDLEPLPHVVFYCGTFFGYTMISFFGTIGILVGRGANPLMEAITTGLAAAMYMFAAILAMYHAEQDFHLMYLSDFEEPLHNFFRHCKHQSIASLAGGFLYLLHCVYAFDVVCITKRHLNIFEDEHEEASQPIHLFFVSETVQNYLESYSWFRRYSVGDLSKAKDEGQPSKIHRSLQRTSRTMPASARTDATASVSSAKTSSVKSKDNHLSGGYCSDGTSSIAETSMTSTQHMDKTEIV